MVINSNEPLYIVRVVSEDHRTVEALFKDKLKAAWIAENDVESILAELNPDEANGFVVASVYVVEGYYHDERIFTRKQRTVMVEKTETYWSEGE